MIELFLSMDTTPIDHYMIRGYHCLIAAVNGLQAVKPPLPIRFA
jgi:hypothetical protein